MKALVYTANAEVTYRDEADPVAAAGDAVVAIEAVGICGSDMHAYLGHDPRRVPPLVLGHEAVGRVLEGDATGQRVLINPLIVCGRCPACQKGRANLCRERDLIGMYRPGAFAERVAIPARNLIEMPQDMDPACAALTEPAATAVHAVNLAARAGDRPLAESRALVIGGGSVGLFAALALRDQGAPEVVLAETNPLRGETARSTGAVTVIDPTRTPVDDSAFDVVVDAVGGRHSRTTASVAVRAGGVLMHIGLMDNDGGLDVRKITLQEVTVIGTYTYTALDLAVTVNKLHRGDFGDLSWREERPLADGARAFDDLLHGRSAAPKIVLRP